MTMEKAIIGGTDEISIETSGIEGYGGIATETFGDKSWYIPVI